jgi:hypothetical protein
MTDPAPLSSASLPVRFPGRFAVAVAGAFAADGSEIARSFRGLSDDGADVLGRDLLDGLDAAARQTGDWLGWAFAANRIPWSHIRQAAAELQHRVDAWTVPAGRRRVPSPRRRLAGLALRLLRGGAGGRELLHHLALANATLDPPLPPDAVDSVALWAAAAVKGARHAP